MLINYISPHNVYDNTSVILIYPFFIKKQTLESNIQCHQTDIDTLTKNGKRVISESTDNIHGLSSTLGNVSKKQKKTVASRYAQLVIYRISLFNLKN